MRKKWNEILEINRIESLFKSIIIYRININNFYFIM